MSWDYDNFIFHDPGCSYVWAYIGDDWEFQVRIYSGGPPTPSTGA